jgi:WD40 repeat protein
MKLLKGKTHSKQINCLILEDQIAITGSMDKKIKVWSLDKKKKTKGFKSLHSGPIQCIQWIEDGKLISGSSDKTIRLWDFKNRKHIKHLETQNPVRSILVDEQMVSGHEDGLVQLWDVQNFKSIGTLTGHTMPIIKIQRLENIMITASLDQTVRIWDARLGNFVRTISGISDITDLDVDIDARIAISSSSNGNVIEWDLGTSKEIITFTLDANINSMQADIYKVRFSINWEYSHHVYYNRLYVDVVMEACE